MEWAVQRISDFLAKPTGRYEQQSWNDFDRLKQVARKGDVLLVEGDQRVSAVIKYLTQSSWSHAALYVGDELLKRGGAPSEEVRQRFGSEAEFLVIEALAEGVSISPLTKYVDYNVRLCRPHRLRQEHLATILDEAIESIGWRYDVQNITELAVFLLRSALRPGPRRQLMGLGSDTVTEVICTSLLGRLFHRVHFPVIPSVTFPEGVEPCLSPERLSLLNRLRRSREPYAALFRKRHPTLLTPRDFDLSPYFEVVKFSLIEGANFDYTRIEWEQDLPATDEVA